MEANEIEVMKDAARRMQDFLSGRGIKVGHAVALEALSASLGARNWRTVRDKLSAQVVVLPAEPAPKTLEDFPDGRWLVKGRYYDGSPYGDYFGGDTARSAAICALYYRQDEDGDASFEVHEVIDRLTDEEADSSILSLSDFDKPSALFKKTLVAAQEVVNYLHLTSAEVMRAIELQAVVTTLRGALESEDLAKTLDNRIHSEWDPEAGVNDVVRFASDEGAVFESNLDSALKALLKLLMDYKGRMSKSELETLEHFEVYSEFFECEIRKILLEHFRAK
jgi:hypothetical protein